MSLCATNARNTSLSSDHFRCGIPSPVCEDGQAAPSINTLSQPLAAGHAPRPANLGPVHMLATRSLVCTLLTNTRTTNTVALSLTVQSWLLQLRMAKKSTTEQLQRNLCMRRPLPRAWARPLRVCRPRSRGASARSPHGATRDGARLSLPRLRARPTMAGSSAGQRGSAASSSSVPSRSHLRFVLNSLCFWQNETA